jgi:hypothetical protein
MDDTKDLKAGLKKYGKNSLEEVKADAAYNYLRRYREQQEQQAFADAKAKGLEEVDKLTQQAIAELKSTKKGK